MNQVISDNLTDNLQAMQMSDKTHECVSTEDFLSKIEDLNSKIREGSIDSTNMMVGSLDVESLYGSIDTKVAAKIVKIRYMMSEMKIEGVDWRWVLIYLKLTMTPHEVIDNNVQGILPRKLNVKTKNSRPRTIMSAEVDENEERWWYPHPPAFLTPEMKKTLMGCVFERMVKIVFNSHFYEWEGQIYLQLKGGPTGLNSVGPVSRCLMDEWVDEVLKL